MATGNFEATGPSPLDSGLVTDFYAFTMAQAWRRCERHGRCCFTFGFRQAPLGQEYIVSAGIEPLLDAIQNLRFDDQDLAFLRATGRFGEDFLGFLATFRFEGDVYSVREGEVVFPGEPVVRVEASAYEGELVAGAVFGHLNYQSLIATKAARVSAAARGVPVLEIGVRRAHGMAGSSLGSRAAYVGGTTATSNVLAGKLFGVPVVGTMSHSWILGFGTDRDAFRAYAACYPDHCTLLLDTYDTLESGLPAAIAVLRELSAGGHAGYGVRIDSGNVVEVVPALRQALDAAGLREAKVFVSGDLDEYAIADLAKHQLPVDGWGVGSRLVTSDGAPFLSGVYKLSGYERRGGFVGCAKRQQGSAPPPGRSNVLRFVDNTGRMTKDVIVSEQELSEGYLSRLTPGLQVEVPLLQLALRGGQSVERRLELSQIREQASRRRHQIPAPGEHGVYPVERSARVQEEIARCS
jgi:nicotinate phosphoribosyltransferase